MTWTSGSYSIRNIKVPALSPRQALKAAVLQKVFNILDQDDRQPLWCNGSVGTRETFIRLFKKAQNMKNWQRENSF